MLSKLDVRSSRVKGIAFHKQRPWVICGLHNGVVQIWDYRMNTSVDTFYISEGGVPTRGVDFHDSQPLFVTGSDDHLVRVWNYKLRRCVYTLAGHVDYIRTTYFHHNQPWILSCSDDYIVRIWNWQNRLCIAMLPGHSHYVMCAQFHPQAPLVASASLDKTIRIWDISALQFKKQEPGLAQDLLGSSDVDVQITIEGHEKPVNWVAFHPTQKSLVVSASDDRTVRVWRISETSYNQVSLLREHTNNVCCVSFFKDNYIISCGEDRTIKVFDANRFQLLMTFRRDLDRYWILATYASKNLIAAGHDTGLQVFKLFRERPAFVLNEGKLIYTHEATLHIYDFESNNEIKFPLSQSHYPRPPYAVSANLTDRQLLISCVNDSSQVDRIVLPQPGNPVKDSVRSKDCADAIFFGPGKYAYVKRNEAAYVGDFKTDKKKKLNLPFSCVRFFQGPTGCVVCQGEENICLYHVAREASIAEAPVTGTRQVVWDSQFNKVAFISKCVIEVRTKRFKPITTVTEYSSKIKSAVFDDTREVLFYTTSNHIKYCILHTGEVNIIATLKSVVYLVKAVGDKVWMLTRSGKVLSKELDNMEMNFKLKLQQQAFRDVVKIIQKRELKGQALVGYLHRHGYSEIALHFVKDPLTRFNLALECGAMDLAKEAAVELDNVSVWRRLSETAINFGDIQLSQLADAKAGNYYSSAIRMLYTGNFSALGHLVDSTPDENFKLQYGMYLNDYEQRVQLLLNANQLSLAYLTAKSNGLDEIATNILSRMNPEMKERVQQVKCNPVDRSQSKTAPKTDNWPMLKVEESIFSKFLKEPGALDMVEDNTVELDEAAVDAWDDESGSEDHFQEANDDDALTENAGGNEGEGWDDELDIDVNAALKSSDATSDANFTVPPPEAPPTNAWVEKSNVAAFHICAGQFGSAFRLLKNQIGLRDPAALKAEALLLWSSVNVSRPTWLSTACPFTLTTEGTSSSNTTLIPKTPKYVPQLLDMLKTGYQIFVEGRFADSHDLFQRMLRMCVFTVTTNDQELASFRELLSVSAEYTRALALQLKLRSIEGTSKEALELSLYLTNFKLQRPHMTLALSQSMTKAYKRKNVLTAAYIAKRLIELDPPKNKAQQCAGIISEAEKTPKDADKLNYDPRNPFTLCSESYKPIYKGTLELVRCGYCLSAAEATYKGKSCSVCGISSYGAECSGLINQV